MDEIQKLRIKSAMIVYALEQALGSYVIENDELKEDLSLNSVRNVVDRERGRGNDIQEDDTKLIVESSYLDEVFGFALDLAKSTVYEEYLNQLKRFCVSLDVFEIRNSVSHPNRKFPECYWFRIAAIASDPLIEKLGLYQVTQALHSAVSGNLNHPPEEWMNNVVWAVPNTLPRVFDHEITGLLGRGNDFKELSKVLSVERNNLIAIVAPGGVGKTALVLQFLKDLSLSPEATKVVDSILFCSLKNEQLTADGLQKIDAIEGTDQIKESLLEGLSEIYEDFEFDSFEDACSKLSDKKVLLCIDNLETLLVDSQKEFIEFNQSLPLHWRIIVTSRISLDSATTVPLEALVKKHAVHLVRNYFKKKGVQDVSQSDLEKISERSNNNPLAIRLTVDLCLKGKDIPESLARSQKDIAAFSYRNLIESLKEHSISSLEAIFAKGNATRSELCELLDLSHDEVAEALNELSRTSLLSRTLSESEMDVYSLSDSIRDLLLVNPKNVDVRKRVSESIKRRKVVIQENAVRQAQRGVTKYDEDYIDSETTETIKLIAVDTNKVLRKRSPSYQELSDLKDRYSDLLAQCSFSYLFNYNHARLLSKLRDTQGEISYLLEAERKNKDSARVKYAIGRFYFDNNDYPQAESYYSKLLELGYDKKENCTSKFSSSVIKGYFLSQLFQGKFDEVIKFTSSWESVEENRAVYGAYRASAFKRSVEHKINSNVNETVEGILQAIGVVKRIFELEGYASVACVEGIRLTKEIHYITCGTKKYPVDFVKKSLMFVADNLFEMLQSVRNYSMESSDVQHWLKNFYDYEIKDNPLHKVSWYKPDLAESYDEEHIKELSSSGYTIVTVYHIPSAESGPSNYIFAEDNDGVQYYLKIDKLKVGGWERWVHFDLGTLLAIKYDDSANGGKTRPATEILELDKA